MPAEAIAEVDLFNYEVSWKGATLGFAKDVDPSAIKLKTKELKIGKWGDITIGRVIIGVEGTIKLTLHQVKRATIAQLLAWSSSGTIPLNPAIRHKDVYDYADAMIIHPVGDGGTTNDISLLKAYPMVSFSKGDGENWREVGVEIEIFPDRTLLATNNYPTYGYYGPPPT